MNMASQKTSSKGQAWFCTTGLPSDVVIEVEEMTFHLHKFPLMSKSQKLHQLIMEQESKSTKPKDKVVPSKVEVEVEVEVEEEDNGGKEEEDGEEQEEESCNISLPDFPGGAETFEMAVKFCYGVKVDVTAGNVVPLRCAAEYLRMSDDFADDNLAARADRFFAASVLPSPKHAIKALKSCEPLLPAADALHLPNRCIDAIASTAAAVAGHGPGPAALFGWPVSGEKARPETPPDSAAVANPVLWNGIDTGVRRKRGRRSSSAATAVDWAEDLAVLGLPVFKRVIAAMKAQGGSASHDLIEASLLAYAKRAIPGLKSSRLAVWRSSSSSSGTVASEADQKELIEMVIENLPPASGRAAAATTAPAKLLFALLKTANILGVSEERRAALERRIGEQLEEAALDDLLLPSYSYLSETLYDVECVERILRHFLDWLEEEAGAVGEEDGGDGLPPGRRKVAAVGKLVDGYLSEVAADGNLKAEKFYDLAVAMPEDGRQFDDGLYRAVDVYLKAHPWLSDEEREKLASVIDCQKLTLEACTHAAQNERLPLRAVVQVLFFEQLHLRQAITGSLLTAADISDPVATSGDLTTQQEEAGGGQETWQTTVRENQVLRLDMDSMRSRVWVLERECSTMRKAIAKIDRTATTTTTSTTKNGKRWGGFGRRFGCKFKTQVCDSHEKGSTIEAKKGRPGQHSREHREVGS